MGYIKKYPTGFKAAPDPSTPWSPSLGTHLEQGIFDAAAVADDAAAKAVELEELTSDGRLSEEALNATIGVVVDEKIPAAVSGAVPGAVADVLTNDPDVVSEIAAQAGETAAQLAVQDGSIVRRNDDIVLTDFDPRGPEETATPVIVDENGDAILDITPATGLLGAQAIRRVQAAADLTDVDPRGGHPGRVDPNGIEDFTASDPITGRPTQRSADLIASVTPSARRAIGTWGLKDPVYVTPRWTGVQRLVPKRDSIVLFGESHVQRMAAGIATAANARGVTAVDRSHGGTNTYEAALRAGAMSPIFTGVPNIPSSGSVNLTAEGPLAVSESSPLTMTTEGVLYAVKASSVVPVSGTLQRVADSGAGLTWQFTNSSGGAVTDILGGYFVSNDPATYNGATVVLGSGINAVITNPNVATIGEAVGQVVAASAAIIDTWRTFSSRLLLIGSLVRANEPPVALDPSTIATGANPQGGWVVREAEAELARCWPDLFYPLRRYVTDQLVYAAGYTPTATDLARMASDCPPESILDPDLQHLNATAAPVAGAHVVSVLAERKYIK